MWNDIVYGKGGLALHAGLKVIPTPHGEKVFMIIGLSGTGKTTTTFTTQNGSRPIQDDFVGLMPGGRAFGTENGCFAKTFGLDPGFEPSIHGAVIKPSAYLENVSQDDDGRVDFFNEHYTKNGRAVFEMQDLLSYEDARNVGPVDYLLILNRNENIIPAVAKLSQEQAAAYFMLGETTGTAAGGAAEEGKFLRVPGTNPFFPLPHGLQGNRLLELLATHPIETYLLNTGRVGGTDGDDRSKKVKIPHTSACVKGIAEGSITFDEDPDFGYLVASEVPGFDDPELLQPRRLYEREGRSDEYAGIVERLKTDRVDASAAVHGAVGGDHQGRRLTARSLRRRVLRASGVLPLARRSVGRGTIPRPAAARRAPRTARRTRSSSDTSSPREPLAVGRRAGREGEEPEEPGEREPQPDASGPVQRVQHLIGRPSVEANGRRAQVRRSSGRRAR